MHIYEYEPFYEQYIEDYNKVVLAVNKVNDHPVSSNICAQLESAITNLEGIQNALADENKDETVVGYKNVVKASLDAIKPIFDFLSGNYTSAERVYIDLKDNLEALQSKDDELKILCENPPRQSQYQTEDGQDDVDRYKKKLKQWRAKVLTLKGDCKNLQARINEYFSFLDSINGCDAANGQVNIRVPESGVVPSKYDAYNSVLNFMGENDDVIDINDGKRVYSDEELATLLVMDKRYLDNYSDSAVNYLESLIINEHSDRSFAALDYALEKGYISDDEYNRLKSNRNYKDIIDNVNNRRMNNNFADVDRSFKFSTDEGLDTLLDKIYSNSQEDAYAIIDYAKNNGFINDDVYSYLTDPNNYDTIINGRHNTQFYLDFNYKYKGHDNVYSYLKSQAVAAPLNLQEQTMNDIEHAYQNGYIDGDEYNSLIKSANKNFVDHYKRFPIRNSDGTSAMTQAKWDAYYSGLETPGGESDVINHSALGESQMNELYPRTVVVQTDSSDLNIRIDPTTNSRVVASIPKGSTVRVGKAESGWAPIYYNTGYHKVGDTEVQNWYVAGYVKDSFLQDVNPTS